MTYPNRAHQVAGLSGFLNLDDRVQDRCSIEVKSWMIAIRKKMLKENVFDKLVMRNSKVYKEPGENEMIKEASIEEIQDVAQLALLLWPEHTLPELVEEMKAIISQEDAVVFLAYEDHDPIGFAQCQLRYDYVEGTSTSPVGYLEGIFVKKPYRKQGVARKLVEACERWARARGCQEFASDCELDNEESYQVHLRLGFKEVNRIVCFKKDL